MCTRRQRVKPSSILRADGIWHLTDLRRRPISQITVTTWRLPLVGVVGIYRLQGLCT